MDKMGKMSQKDKIMKLMTFIKFYSTMKILKEDNKPVELVDNLFIGSIGAAHNKKALKESVIKSREFLDKDENVCYGEDEMSFFAANYLRNEFRRFPDIVKAKACAQEMLQREKQQRAEEMSGLRY